MRFEEKYFLYMKELVSDSAHNADEYDLLFKALNKKEFYSVIECDDNRIADAAEFRADFERNNGHYEPVLTNPISVLEIMVSLAVRCEDSIMGNFEYGNRTGTWFWYMIYSLGLAEMDDWNYDSDVVEGVLDDFLEHNYDFNGRGSLFLVENTSENFRNMEIWYQMMAWLNTIDE